MSVYKIVMKFINEFRYAVASGTDASGLIILVNELEEALKAEKDNLDSDDS